MEQTGVLFFLNLSPKYMQISLKSHRHTDRNIYTGTCIPYWLRFIFKYYNTKVNLSQVLIFVVDIQY